MDGTAPPLPPEAERVARNWLRLTPQVRSRVADMIEEMVDASKATKGHVEDERVEEAYGRPGSRKPDKPAKPRK